MQTHQEFCSLNYLLSIYFFVGVLNRQLVYLLHDLIFFKILETVFNLPISKPPTFDFKS